MSDVFYSLFPQRLRLLRRAQRMSCTTLADLLGVEPNQIYVWERGVRCPRVDYVVALARALDVPVTAFFPPAEAWHPAYREARP